MRKLKSTTNRRETPAQAARMIGVKHRMLFATGSKRRLEAEDDFVIRLLLAFEDELKTPKARAQTIDKYACILTAYMNGKVVQALNGPAQQRPDQTT